MIRVELSTVANITIKMLIYFRTSNLHNLEWKKNKIYVILFGKYPFLSSEYLHHYFDRHVCLSGFRPSARLCITKKLTSSNQQRLQIKIVAYTSVMKKIALRSPPTPRGLRPCGVCRVKSKHDGNSQHVPG